MYTVKFMEYGQKASLTERVQYNHVCCVLIAIILYYENLIAALPVGDA